MTQSSCITHYLCALCGKPKALAKGPCGRQKREWLPKLAGQRVYRARLQGESALRLLSRAEWDALPAMPVEAAYWDEFDPEGMTGVNADGLRVPVFVEALGAGIRPLDLQAQERARQRLDVLTKPPGSMGRLEELAVQLAGITGELAPDVFPATVVVMAGDHGVTAEGVSAYPSEVTPQMVLNFLGGGAAINVLARAAGARVRVVDMGVAADLEHPALDSRKIRRGAGNIAREPAMSRAEAEAAVAAGMEIAREEIERGVRALCLGEMGIGNTTPASAILAAFGGFEPAAVCGRGTGLDDAGVCRKQQAVAQALAANRPDPSDPWDVLAKLGGLEIAGLAGVILGAAQARRPVILDGFITGAAALVAARMAPQAAAYMIASHQSVEPGHRLMLELLGLKPVLQLDLRLGEGTGAALALPVIDAATRVMREMATFGEAGVSGSVAEVAGAGKSGEPAGGLPVRVPGAFAARDRQAVYRAIEWRRDIRHFRPDPVPDDVLARILEAAHMAPSVGLSQPWNFILIRDLETKQRLHAAVDRERRAAGIHFTGERADLYHRLKVEGLLEAPVTLCVAVDPSRGGPHVLGRNSDPNTSLYSASCAIQNLWLAARAEGLGAGWVSIYQKADVRDLLGMPPHIDPIGLICIGYTDAFTDRPLLELQGWERRRPLHELLFFERWGEKKEG